MQAQNQINHVFLTAAVSRALNQSVIVTAGQNTFTFSSVFAAVSAPLAMLINE